MGNEGKVLLVWGAGKSVRHYWYGIMGNAGKRVRYCWYGVMGNPGKRIMG